VSIRILYVAEIVGKAGVFTVKKLLPAAIRELGVDFVIGNADSATGGAGLGRQHCVYLRKLGIEAITTGECAYYKRDIVEHMPKAPYLLRPANYPYGNPGRGYKVFTAGTAAGPVKVAVVELLGQAGFSRVHLANPYQAISDLGRKLREETPIVILDFHAATTAEKLTMSYHAGGLVSAVIGSHTKAQTADARIARGTAYITDAGRTGVQIWGADATNNLVVGNFIGTDVSGAFAVPNDWGVSIQFSANRIGDGSTAGRNSPFARWIPSSANSRSTATSLTKKPRRTNPNEPIRTTTLPAPAPPRWNGRCARNPPAAGASRTHGAHRSAFHAGL